MPQHDCVWEELILDAAPGTEHLGSLAVGDVDGDGNVEMIIGSKGALYWYRPMTFEKGVISAGEFGVGLALDDVDGDGLPEVVASFTKATRQIAWFKPSGNPERPWHRHIIEPAEVAGAHDLVFADVDGDGENELLAVTTSHSTPLINIYKRGADPKVRWAKYLLQKGRFQEGLSAGDLNGDGRLEVVCGPYLYVPPAEGPLSGLWERSVYAPSLREMCRTALLDITGNGRPDIVVCESEFMDGRLSWFENRIVEEPGNPWIEHPLERGLIYAHSLQAWQDADTGSAHFFLAEMAEGGWNAPRNLDARLIEYSTPDNGKSWNREVLHRGSGTHEALPSDIDGDGVPEICGKQWLRPKVHVFKRRAQPSPLTRFRHRFLDRDKPNTATDILAADIDGDGRADVACGQWWYKNPTWERYTIPGIYQVHCAYDIDGDGRDELIATRKNCEATTWFEGLTSELCWLKPVDPVNGTWEEHYIGAGDGDWPHGSLVAPLLPGGKLALIVAFHNAYKGHPPEIYEVPGDPTQPWEKRIFTDVPYREEMVACDVDGDGKLDIAAGPYWFENLGDGTFKAHKIADSSGVARVRVADVNGNGRPDILFTEEALDYPSRKTSLSRIIWLENPEDPRSDPWPLHVIDMIRSPHSLDVADLDGDGELEVIVGEHDPFRPYRSRCGLYAYKKADPQGRAWFRHVIDDRFEHHDGARVFEIKPGRLGIISHGWADSIYVNLWEQY